MASPQEPGAPHIRPEENVRHGRLSFRLRPPTSAAPPPGLVELGRRQGSRPDLVYVPSEPERPLRLVLLLHGAGGDGQQALDLLRPYADSHHLLLVAPSSAGATWDMITGGYGPDVQLIDTLLGLVAAQVAVAGVSVGGFSDGASYALSLGLANGDVLDSVLAFSPGFSAALIRHGRPRVFVSHGRDDSVLPIERCSRRLVPQLEQNGYDVTYVEFAGGHAVPAEVIARALAWLG